MDKIEKLLNKISKKDKKSLLLVLQKLIEKNKNLNVVKIKNTDFLRLKHKKFRIIFHIENKNVIIDGIRLRNENTYKNL